MKKKKFLSEVGFEPTPSYEDQKSLYYSLSREQGMYLESGALDHSAILTGLLDWGKTTLLIGHTVMSQPQ